MSRFSRRALLLASLSGSILSSSPLLAQEAAETGYDDEIVVTAQKREENLQNVPISIQALSTRKLDQLNIDVTPSFPPAGIRVEPSFCA